ncbi:MAG: DUF1080 domain-containing protein [Planctomycetes bacterium]|nr:DUF1080 domain-containing protein [Planctomycetota bacterium]
MGAIRVVAVLLLAICALLFESVLSAQGRPQPEFGQLYPHAGLEAAAAARAMKLPDGFQVQVGAAEPDVRQPIAMTIDERGRVWVAEAYEYPRRAKEGEERDRILIFEDTDLDGSLDKRTVFAEQLNLVSGIEVGFGGLFVGAAPHLLFIPDRDRDDRPDGPPEVLLDGWGFEDTHETLNALMWGPDGWLYGCHGVFTHSKVGKPGTPDDQRVRLNAGVWRYHPLRGDFELFAEGTSNPWGIDFDDEGQAFITACVIPHLFHMIQGGRYERQAGNHFNEHTYADIKTIADHLHYTGNQWNNSDRRESDGLGGGHAHAGAMIYLGGAWPAEYRQRVIMNNIHGNRLNADILQPRGSGFVGSHGPDFMLTGDQWSQMLYLRYGPDGQVWVLDWYDANQCHHRDRELHDRSNGRIYRISYRNAPPVRVDLNALSDVALVELQTDLNDWYVRQSRKILQYRASQKKLEPQAVSQLVRLATSSPRDRERLRAWWCLHCTGNIDEPLLRMAMRDASAAVRAWAIQLALEPARANQALSEVTGRIVPELERLAREDDSPRVRLYLASAAQRIPPERRWTILEGLASHAEDAGDQNLPLMIWYAAEPLAAVDAARAIDWALAAGERMPMLREFMVRRMAAQESESTLSVVVDRLTRVQSTEGQLAFLRGWNHALRGRRRIAAPAAWNEISEKFATSDSPEVRYLASLIDLRGERAAGWDRATAIVRDPQAVLAWRQNALSVLVQSEKPQAAELVRSLLDDPLMAASAIRSLASLDDPQASDELLRRYPQSRADLRRDILATLSARPATARRLLAAVSQRQIPSADLSADLVRQLRNLRDAELNADVERIWGTVRDTSVDIQRQISRWKASIDLPGRTPDLELGRAVFAKTCQQCHRLFGSGAELGPDLTGSNRANLDYLLSNILDPSAVMAKEYQPAIISTASGRTITGIIRESAGNVFTVRTATESIELAKDDIDEMKLSEKSMMPDDLLKPLTMHEARSLIAYLGSSRQSPVLATPETVKSLFNGVDLTGWVGDQELWSVEQGEIVGRTAGLARNAFLFSELAVEDFQLSLQVKLIPNSENSGIQFRSQPMPDGEIKGYQADIGAGWWGKLYEEHGRGLLWPRSGEMHVRVGDWNQYDIIAIGSRIRTWINGERCVDMEDPLGDRRGVIAFQLHAGKAMEVRFRDLKLVDLTRRDALQATYRSSIGGAVAGGTVGFRKRVLEPVFRGEGVASGDFNNDGRLDIAAGSIWFEAPNWDRHSIVDAPREFSIREYSNSFCNWSEDVDRDGRLDLIVVDFPGRPTRWFRNPGNAGGAWSAQVITPVTNNESPAYLDVDRDGRRELVLGMSGSRIGFSRPAIDPTAEWDLSPLSAVGAPGGEPFSHGLGVGDVNGDGRDDVLVTAGWWESPASQKGGEWRFHPADFGGPAAQMYVFDFDGDGDSDVLSSSAHQRGIWWHEQLAEDKWVTHEIDNRIAQTHALCLADINGDGLPDIVTGKRYYAHNGRDPGEDEPAVLFWFELVREAGKSHWIPHRIDDDSGVGTQFEVVDMNADGALDVIVANKKGIFYFEQTRRSAP